VVWGSEVTDVIVGTLPISVVIPARSDDPHVTEDQLVEIELGDVPLNMIADFWFDVVEREVRHDF
jgi:hypothetical protein